MLGRPIGHSLSPVLHRAAYAALGLNWDYEAIDCGEADLPGVLAARTGWAGFSCTMPLKRAVLDVADEVRTRARVAGAGNTLLPRTGGGWVAENTDIDGVLGAIRERGIAPRTVTVLGAGGTAQAVIAALPELHVDRCAVLVRDLTRTEAARATAAAAGVTLDVGGLDVDHTALRADLVVSTLPAGAADRFGGATWRPQQAVLDVVYDPWPTPLATAAAAAGATVLSGALMLLHQAVRQVELMTARSAPVDAMRTALLAARPDCGVPATG